jgi:putative ABC transport system permease protein
MTSLRVLVSRVLDVMLSGRRDRRLTEEMAAHLDLLTEDHVRRGLSLDAARAAARRDFGRTEPIADAHRDQRGLPAVDALVQDARFALRLLVRDRGFTLAAVVALALGIGVDTMMFTVMYGLCLRGLPIAGADRVMYVAGRDAADRPLGFSRADFEDVRAGARAFSGLAAFGGGAAAIGDEGRAPERITAAYVTANTFGLIGERPVAGRDFAADDERPESSAVVILENGLWQRRYGGDPAILGRVVRVNGSPVTVIGVMRSGFRFPNNADVWRPLGQMSGIRQQPRSARALGVFGRLTNGTSPAQARSDVAALMESLSRMYPDTNRGIRATVDAINERFMGRITDPAWLAFLTAGALILIIACANVANLLLTRAAHRSREIAVRASLGATRRRVVRQLLVESALLAVLGASLGFVFSLVGLQLFLGSHPENALPYWATFEPDWGVFGYLVAISVATIAVFGLAPALHAAKTDVTELLKDGGRAASGGRHARRWTAAFLTAEFALTMILLSAVGFSVKTARASIEADAAIDSAPLLTLWISLPQEKYRTAADRRAFFDTLDARLGAMPAVASVSIASALPYGGALMRQVEVEGRPPAAGGPAASAWTVTVGPRYFETIGVRLLRGRAFDRDDGLEGREHVIVNQRFVDLFFPQQNAVGRRLMLPADASAQPARWLTVVGVSPNVRQRALLDTDPLVYLPAGPSPQPTTAVIVRATSDPAALPPLVREEVRALDPDLPIYRVMTLDRAIYDSRWNSRVSAGLITTIAGIALLLSAVGLYAVTAHAVTARTHEMGLRLALGARPGQIAWLVVRRALWQLTLGLGFGLVGMFVWVRLFVGTRTSQSDPTVLVAVAGVLTLVAMAACLWPALRAAHLDPVAALRRE